MAEFSREEVIETYERYVEARHRVESGELGWDALAAFFSDDAVFIDPAWGRVEGIDEIRKFLAESMQGLDDWDFPHLWTMVDGNRLLARWTNRLPGSRPDGSRYEAPGYSLMIYAGDGKFSYEEDLLNMTHIGELMRDSGWKPKVAMNVPPRQPIRRPFDGES
ncbi:MAG: nuclear transport factor 2 family protein [Myxococcota bacterium]